jgi:Ser/Thr protein kinase RdoA (MazF antagonist)
VANGDTKALARRVLTHYDLDTERISRGRQLWNTIFEVRTRDGGRYALRINRPGHRTETEIRSELLWLDALRNDTDLMVPTPIHTRDGDLIVTDQLNGEPRHAALFTWLPGRHVARRRPPSRRSAYLLGRTTARLHNHADTFRPPETFSQTRFDRIASLGNHSTIHSDEPSEILTPERKARLREATAEIQEETDRLYEDPSGLRFLHADMHFGNVKLIASDMGVLDFDDSLWCFPVQDIGIAMYYLQLRGNKEDLTRAFREGYERIRPWPEEHPGQAWSYVRARALDLINVSFELDDPGYRAQLPRIIEFNEKLIFGAEPET